MISQISLTQFLTGVASRSVLSWNISGVEDINEESLHLFTILEPKLDLIVLGIGDTLQDRTFHKRIFPLLKSKRMNIEILPTESACATFNFLNSEGRCVAAALIPPKVIKTSDDDLVRTKMRYENLYETKLF